MTVLVVGAGVIGAAVADALAARGARVIVLDMRSAGRGASHASAGILAPYTEAHDGHPLLEFGVRSLNLFDAFVSSLVERSGLTVEYSRAGTLEVALDAADAAKLSATKTWLDTRHIACDWLEGDALRSAEPAVVPTAAGGLLINTHGFVAVPSLVRALVQSARLGGAWFESPVEVTQVEPRADGVDVRAGSRVYSADSVVIATGSWSKRVRVTGLPALPVRPVRGQLLRLRWPGADPPRRVTWGPRCYTVPWPDGTLLVGATAENAGFDENSTVAGVYELMGAAGQLLPRAWQASVEQVRVGLRPAAPDDLPMIGPLAGAPRITVATAHYRNGILLAPLTAAIVSRYVLDGVSDPAFKVTTPDRFADRRG
jgi:glycine oxidase